MSTTRMRLTPAGENIRPFRRAREEAGCELYWIGVPAFPNLLNTPPGCAIF